MTAHSAHVTAFNAAPRQLSRISFLFQIKICLAFLLFFTTANLASTAQCVAPNMSFHSPVLIEGTDNQIGAVYLFAEVLPGVDANIKVTDLVGGAVLYNIDDSTGIGYYDAFQPYIVAPANVTSYLDWEITFKVAGTSTDTVLACFAITGIDIDGNGSDLQEFIEAATPGSYALDPYTILNFSFDGVRSKAISLVDNIPNIDTAHREAMFQMNFQNISTLQYRNGAISSHGGDMVRQTCIYFKSFFDTYSLLLPVKLISFTARSGNASVLLSWSAANENNLKNYVVQKSINGINWRDLNTVLPAGGATNDYFVTDAEKNGPLTYYRIKQIQRTGRPVYTKMLTVHSDAVHAASITNSTMVKDVINLQISAMVNDTYQVDVYAMNGTRIKQQQLVVYAGYNTASVDMPLPAGNGLYVLSIKNNRGELIHQSKLVKN